MIKNKVPVKSEKTCPYEQEKLVNDEKWCKFVQKRAMKKKPIIDTSELGNCMNPFSQELQIEVSIRLDPEAKIMDEHGCPIPASSIIEKAQSTKLYQSAVYRDRAMKLSATAMRMFVFICYELEAGKDWIDIDPEWYLQAAGNGSRNMHKKATVELARYGYISPTLYKHVFWINPALIFNGNRVKKYPNNIVWKNTYTGKAQPKQKPKLEKKAFKGFGKTTTTIKNGEVNTVEN